jgi:hypothetical protein
LIHISGTPLFFLLSPAGERRKLVRKKMRGSTQPMLLGTEGALR